MRLAMPWFIPVSTIDQTMCSPDPMLIYHHLIFLLHSSSLFMFKITNTKYMKMYNSCHQARLSYLYNISNSQFQHTVKTNLHQEQKLKGILPVGSLAADCDWSSVVLLSVCKRIENTGRVEAIVIQCWQKCWQIKSMLTSVVQNQSW